MVGFYSTFRRFYALIICLLPFACIEETGDYASVPTEPSLKYIRIKDGDYSTTGSAWGNVTTSGTKSEIAWGTSSGFNPLSFATLPKSTTVTFTDAKLIKEINTTFNDNKKINDYFEYDSYNRITKARRQDEANGLEYIATFYYKSNNLDSIALEHSVTASGKVTKQTGFFKKANATMFVSIFPFDKTVSYTLMDNYLASTNTYDFEVSGVSTNDLNKWSHQVKEDNSYAYGQRSSWDVTTQMRITDQWGITHQSIRAKNIDYDPSYMAYESPTTYFRTQGIELETNKYSNQGVSYPVLLSAYFPNPYLLDQVFYRIDHSKKVEYKQAVNYEIVHDYNWN